ncbi:MAG: 2-amino-4-hydroxy-6-hydroxymethyldihydropteridine diphosphokinase [Candidatus Heimdallarchaeota archaeon]|nr:2-amino-4-hydroxy-6-hydroxymethyldihydropteridine diphosphokinase [Candidatus Heimdallarchaeota archaeon]
MVAVLLGIGTNVGNRLENLQQCIQGISVFGTVISLSPVYETLPWGFEDQADFLNMCVEIETEKPPLELLTEIKLLEKRLGRKKTFNWGPRIIDIDILLYGSVVIETENLIIPHPEMIHRAFVLVPLADIAGQWIHPIKGKSISALVEEINQDGISRIKDKIYDKTE